MRSQCLAGSGQAAPARRLAWLTAHGRMIHVRTLVQAGPDEYLSIPQGESILYGSGPDSIGMAVRAALTAEGPVERIPESVVGCLVENAGPELHIYAASGSTDVVVVDADVSNHKLGEQAAGIARRLEGDSIPSQAVGRPVGRAKQ